jgi:hypothetical protein
MPFRQTVFISYAREDFEAALEIFEYLKSIGVEPWMDKKNLIGGEDWESAINRAVRKCDFFLFCASEKSASKRGAVQKEIKLALAIWREKLEDDIYFIPVRLQPCELPESISRFQWIDYFEKDAKGRIHNSIVSGAQRHQSDQIVLPLQFQTRTLKDNNNNKWDVTIEFPEFLPANAVGIPEINSALSVFANQSKAKFVAQFGDYDFLGERMPFHLHISFSVTLVAYHLISVRFSEGIYTGGAHPNYYTRTFNFVRDPWYEFDIEYLAANDKFYEFFKTISDACIDDIIRQRVQANSDWVETKLPSLASIPEQDSWLRRGASPDPKNFGNFCLEPDSLLFVFDPYHVGSYAEGRSEVRLSLKIIGPYIRPNFLAKLQL